jgi:hypothetical protein
MSHSLVKADGGRARAIVCRHFGDVTLVAPVTATAALDFINGIYAGTAARKGLQHVFLRELDV